MNGYLFRENNSFIFLFASNLSRGQVLKTRICSHWSKFFPVRVISISNLKKRACSHWSKFNPFRVDPISILKRICCHWSKFFPLRVNHILKRAALSGKANRKAIRKPQVVSLCENGRKSWRCSHRPFNLLPETKIIKKETHFSLHAHFWGMVSVYNLS